MTKINMNEIIVGKIKMFKIFFAKPTMVKLLTMSNIKVFKIIMAKLAMDKFTIVLN
jgi:hypothetical protein